MALEDFHAHGHQALKTEEKKQDGDNFKPRRTFTEHFGVDFLNLARTPRCALPALASRRLPGARTPSVWYADVFRAVLRDCTSPTCPPTRPTAAARKGACRSRRLSNLEPTVLFRPSCHNSAAVSK